jgi:hypothetical protein
MSAKGFTVQTNGCGRFEMRKEFKAQRTMPLLVGLGVLALGISWFYFGMEKKDEISTGFGIMPMLGFFVALVGIAGVIRGLYHFVDGYSIVVEGGELTYGGILTPRNKIQLSKAKWKLIPYEGPQGGLSIRPFIEMLFPSTGLFIDIENGQAVRVYPGRLSLKQAKEIDVLLSPQLGPIPWPVEAPPDTRTPQQRFIASLPPAMAAEFESYIQQWMKSRCTMEWTDFATGIVFALSVSWNRISIEIFKSYTEMVVIMSKSDARRRGLPDEIYQGYKRELMDIPVFASAFAKKLDAVLFADMQIDDFRLLLKATDAFASSLITANYRTKGNHTHTS